MAVILLEPWLLDRFLIFLKIFEYKSISLISRMYHDGKITVPSIRFAKIFCELADSKPNIVLNAIMITSTGTLLPMFSETHPSSLVIKEMLRLIIDYKKDIFCILGISRDIKTINSFLNYSLLSKIKYLLLKEDISSIFKIDRTFFKIKKAKKADILQIFPLEKKYLLEEVLIDVFNLNQKAVLINLQKTCNTYSIFYAISGKEIIGKVNTNAKGIEYDQIGGVYTKPEYRNKGVSTCLMKALLNETHLSGKKTILYVKKNNKPALALYKKLGFDIIDEYSAYYIKS